MENNKFIEARKYINEMTKVVDIEHPERLEVFDWDQLNVIYEGILTGIDCIEFFIQHNFFDPFQMDEILDGMREGIDFHLYANENFSWKKMMIIKMALLNGYTSEDIEESGFLDENISWIYINNVMHGLA